MAAEQERSSRRMTSIRARMLRHGDWIEVIIANLSESGLMAKASDIPAMGETVEIRHRGYAIHGEVVWISGRRFGVQANAPIDLTQMLSASELAARRAEDNAPTARFWHWMKKR